MNDVIEETLEARTPVANRALLCVGYGCFLATFSGAPFNAEYVSGWVPSLFAVLGFYGGLAGGCFGLRLLLRHGALGIPAALAPIVYALVTLLGLALEWALGGFGPGFILLVVISAIQGCVAAIPLLFWYERLFATYRLEGRMWFIAVQGIATVLSVGSLCVLVVANNAGVVLFVVEVLGCAACQLYGECFLPRRMGARACEGASYETTPYSLALLMCVGVAWGLLCGTYAWSSAGRSMGEFWQPYVVSFVAVALCSLLLVGVIGRRRLHFGALVRLIVMALGIALATMPLVQRFVPDAALPLCQVLFALGDIAIVLFTIDVCRERSLPVGAVLPMNFGIYAAAVCMGALVFYAIMSAVEGSVAWECFAALGAAVAVALVPFLPSRSSEATVFTLRELPENEGYDLFIARRREGIVGAYGLTERESEVVAYLLRNMTRQQIAEELHLSQWTVKDRIKAIYRKMGVHSYKEFINAIEAGDD